MSSLKFGTSGLRGLVTDLVGWPSYAYASAFFRSVAATAGEGASERIVVIGRDLRDSSAGIAATVANAAAAAGFSVYDCGALPTPALALEAIRRGACAVMVTGSHIPSDRNGLKFYRPDGEITKTDEVAILAALGDITKAGDMPKADSAIQEPGAIDRYRQRYTDAFAPTILAGQRIAVYQQSSVARDLLADVLAALGADIVPIGRSDSFIPIDTEAHRPEDIAFIRDAMASGGFDALVTTDGDADRPLLADAAGRIVRGDVLGLITARYLGVDTVVVPVTAGSAIEHAGGFRSVLRTKVGSPFVIAGMDRAKSEGASTVVGFEANGGFLLGSDVVIDGKTLLALPTRDAILPIVATLAAAQEARLTLAELVTSLNVGETASDRLPNTPAERSGALLRQLGQDSFRGEFFRPIGTPQGVDEQDGVRVELDGGRTIHFRPSGNAPELRCYAEAGSAADAEELVRWGLAAAAAAMTN
ncbi:MULTISPECIES: phosphomannomutase [unclassified Methylobacterium]|uniref:phosphomannomutase n=1 Tax=unclassified Methylobacterium TaxID=2615210 RepID=UPI00070205DD|nr:MULTISPECIES: phosphomannomutase [unclassified Methylobacterium]KQO58148.1 phosphomannomutase [Methylobacterium sp. Leaf86]KQO97206.1 phosphomannomutase [Methylobacterium sp. Leaf91]